MHQLQPIQIDDNTVIYMEAIDTITAPPSQNGYPNENGEVQRGGAKGGFGNPSQAMAQSFRAIETTIKAYTQFTLNAFRDAGLSEVKKVTLEFGVNVSGVGGVPYIATGTAGCNIKVTVECAFPEAQAVAIGSAMTQ
ncbi:MAG: hypothetical protein HC881_05105 [Leptolyngbyaceae cyanobacterium SL_7_1]|nr:hypothetical protein [Leptolyngbyaceae cyanobacterium SL_7_1]